MVEIPIMVMKTVINIQEDRTVEEVIVVEWDPEIMITVAAINLQETNMVTIVTADGELVAVIGEPGVMKVVVPTVDILKISI